MSDVGSAARSSMSCRLRTSSLPWASARVIVLSKPFVHDHADVHLAVAGRDAPGNELRGDLLARRQDRLDQLVAVQRPADGRQVRPDLAAAAVHAMADVAARPRAWKKTRSPAAASPPPPGTAPVGFVLRPGTGQFGQALASVSRPRRLAGFQGQQQLGGQFGRSSAWAAASLSHQARQGFSTSGSARRRAASGGRRAATPDGPAATAAAAARRPNPAPRARPATASARRAHVRLVVRRPVAAASPARPCRRAGPGSGPPRGAGRVRARRNRPAARPTGPDDPAAASAAPARGRRPAARRPERRLARIFSSTGSASGLPPRQQMVGRQQRQEQLPRGRRLRGRGRQLRGQVLQASPRRPTGSPCAAPRGRRP